jgi:hypothetical protein
MMAAGLVLAFVGWCYVIAFDNAQRDRARLIAFNVFWFGLALMVGSLAIFFWRVMP